VLALDGHEGRVFWVEAGASGDGRSEDSPAGNITYVLEAYDLTDSIVRVKPGVYNAQIERFPIILNDRGLTLEAVSDDPSDTIIHGPGIKEDEIEENVVIKVVADKITIKGFTIKEGNRGIFVVSPYNIIYGNIITNNRNGISIWEWFIPGRVWWRGSNNTVKDNIITRNGVGVIIQVSSENRIVENIIVRNGYGVKLFDGENNVVKGNLIGNNSIGVSLESFDRGNLIAYNNISYNRRYGVFVSESASDNTIEGNIIAYNGKKNIWISPWPWGAENIIKNNIIKDQDFIRKELLSPTLIASIITLSLAISVGFYLLKRKL
jgi:parallel beta-helix repeat protein